MYIISLCVVMFSWRYFLLKRYKGVQSNAHIFLLEFALIFIDYLTFELTVKCMLKVAQRSMFTLETAGLCALAYNFASVPVRHTGNVPLVMAISLCRRMEFLRQYIMYK